MKSFKVCGIPNATDESEDNLIRCFSDAGKIPTGTAKLSQARADKQLAVLMEEIDLNEDINNLDYDSDGSVLSYEKKHDDEVSSIFSLGSFDLSSDNDVDDNILEKAGFDWDVNENDLDESLLDVDF